MSYDAAKDSHDSYFVAIAAMREKHLVATIPGVKRARVIGRCELMLGDCTEIMPHLDRVDACVTDPPYGIGRGLTSGGSGRGFHRMHSSNSHEWDFTPSAETFDIIRSISDDQIIWGGNYFDLPPTKKPLCWDKVRPNQKNLSEWEMAWTSLQGRAQMFTKCANGGFVAAEANVHPTQKPVALMEWCLGFLPNADTILDTFMGSGTTLVACAKLGRRGIGIELDESYFDIAVRRVEEAYRQPDLFVEQPAPMPTQEAMDL